MATFQYKPRRTVLTDPQKTEVAVAYNKGDSAKTISENFGISISQVYVILRNMDGKEI